MTIGNIDFFKNEGQKPRFFSSVDLEQITLKDLKKIHSEINYLSKNFDPFTEQMPSKKIQRILRKYNLTALTKNPYSLTNVILQFLSKIEHKLDASS